MRLETRLTYPDKPQFLSGIGQTDPFAEIDALYAQADYNPYADIDALYAQADAPLVELPADVQDAVDSLLGSEMYYEASRLDPTLQSTAPTGDSTASQVKEWIGIVKGVADTYFQYSTEKELFDANLERVQRGLPAIGQQQVRPRTGTTGGSALGQISPMMLLALGALLIFAMRRK